MGEASKSFIEWSSIYLVCCITNDEWISLMTNGFMSKTVSSLNNFRNLKCRAPYSRHRHSFGIVPNFVSASRMIRFGTNFMTTSVPEPDVLQVLTTYNGQTVWNFPAMELATQKLYAAITLATPALARNTIYLAVRENSDTLINATVIQY